MQATGHKTWIEINTQAYKDNICTLKSLLSEGVIFCSVLKADAYGHGLPQMLKLALGQDITYFAVDSIDEARIIRTISSQAQIFILGYTVSERLIEVVKLNCIQTVFDAETITQLAHHASELKTKAFVNIEIETGTRRLGADQKAIRSILFTLQKEQKKIICLGISSHFSSSELVSEPNITYAQDVAFCDAIKRMQQFDICPTYKHISCSASTLLYKSTHHNMVRVGLAQYGLWPSDDVRKKIILGQKHIDLKPILSWKTRIAQIKDIGSGVPVGYDQTFISDKPMRIAVLPVGYFDGYSRLLCNSHVLIHGQKCQIIGTICMNMMMVDISAIGQAKQDDIATLIGRDGMNQISADLLSQYSNTINYEITTRIQSSLPRICV